MTLFLACLATALIAFNVGYSIGHRRAKADAAILSALREIRGTQTQQIAAQGPIGEWRNGRFI